MEISPIPVAMPGPILTAPRATLLETNDEGTPVQPADDPQGFMSFAANGVAVVVTLYAIPGGQTFIITSAFCTLQGATGTYATLQRGAATNLAQQFIAGTSPVDLCGGKPIAVAGGANLRLNIGTGGSPISCTVIGYLVSPTSNPAPQLTQIQTAPIG